MLPWIDQLHCLSFLKMLGHHHCCVDWESHWNWSRPDWRDLSPKYWVQLVKMTFGRAGNWKKFRRTFFNFFSKSLLCTYFGNDWNILETYYFLFILLIVVFFVFLLYVLYFWIWEYRLNSNTLRRPKFNKASQLNNPF